MRKRFLDYSLQCSFCKRSQETVAKLISSPSDYPRAYICNECVAVCASIIEDERASSQEPEEGPSEGLPHPLLSHPLASNLMEAVERWMREESLGNDGGIELGEVRAIADKMMYS